MRLLSMQKRKSLYDAVEDKLIGIKGLSEYLSIFEKDIIAAYPILFLSPNKNDYLYKKARDYFFFAVIPSIEIIKNEKLKGKYEKDLIKIQTLLALSERFLNNVVDGHSKCIEDDMTLYAYTVHEAVYLLDNDFKNTTGISTDEFFKKFRKVAQAVNLKIPNKNKLSKNKTNVNIGTLANYLWKRASSIFIMPSFLGTTPQGIKALENHISANILLDDLLDLFDDYRYNRETLPLFLWKTYSQEMIFNKWATDFVTKETLNIIIKLLDKSYKLFEEDGLKYSLQVTKILKGKYCEWFPERI